MKKCSTFQRDAVHSIHLELVLSRSLHELAEAVR